MNILLKKIKIQIVLNIETIILNMNFDSFFCLVLLKTVKILEAYYIKTCQPSPNNQINSDVLNLFRNGVTLSCSFYPSCIYFFLLNVQKYFVYIIKIFTI